MGRGLGKMSNEKVISFVDKRRAICNECEFKIKVIGADVCSKCGCAIWGKVRLSGQKCPEGKWNAE
jgi:hypothetical protein